MLLPLLLRCCCWLCLLPGTSRASRYICLLDELGLGPDGLQVLTYWMCYLYCRCTRCACVVYMCLLCRSGQVLRAALVLTAQPVCMLAVVTPDSPPPAADARCCLPPVFALLPHLHTTHIGLLVSFWQVCLRRRPCLLRTPAGVPRACAGPGR